MNGTEWTEPGQGGMFLTRTKQYASPGSTARFAWKYLYDVHCPTPVSEGHATCVSSGHESLAEARAWMRRRTAHAERRISISEACHVASEIARTAERERLETRTAEQDDVTTESELSISDYHAERCNDRSCSCRGEL